MNESFFFATIVLFVLNFLPSCLSAQEPLRAGTIFSATQAPLWAAREGRYFEKYGIKNLEVIQFSGGQPVTRALIGGDIQISTTGGAAVVNARLKGADTIIIARTVGVFPYTLYVSKEIRDPSELKGKKLAVSTVGGSGYVAMQYALRNSAWIPTKTSPCCRWVTSARASRRWRPERFRELCSFHLLRCARKNLV
jgi:ABC-type nitrate/sulfonate/bicarbonate transport system substrate-binding protein